MIRTENIGKQFRNLFEAAPITARSPGRINLIGEHTDYNDGFVLPAAIDKYVYAAVGKRADDRIRVYAVQYNEFCEIRMEDVKPQQQNWPNYVLGVVDQLIKRGHGIGGFNMLIDGEVPVGAGMSSSAAVECAVVTALSELFSLNLSQLAKVMIAQAAEHEYAGVRCGIMDQYSSVFGKKGMAIKLDCRKHWHEHVPLKLDGYKIVLFDTNIKHSLAASAYNQRRQECEEGVKQIQKHLPTIKSLRDTTLTMLYECVDDELVRKRCSYVIKENARLLAGCEDLRIGDIASFGEKMFTTHKGLKEDYEVSCTELDYLVNSVVGRNGVIGARMMGGGFGGCTINIIKEEHIEDVFNTLTASYKKDMGKQLTAYIAETADGAAMVKQSQLV